MFGHRRRRATQVRRVTVVFWLATAAALLGVGLRTRADVLARNIPDSGPGWSSVTHYSVPHYEFYSTLGWLLVGVGVALYAVVARLWVGRRQPSAGPQEAEPGAAAAGPRL